MIKSGFVSNPPTTTGIPSISQMYNQKDKEKPKNFWGDISDSNLKSFIFLYHSTIHLLNMKMYLIKNVARFRFCKRLYIMCVNDKNKLEFIQQTRIKSQTINRGNKKFWIDISTNTLKILVFLYNSTIYFLKLKMANYFGKDENKFKKYEFLYLNGLNGQNRLNYVINQRKAHKNVF